jgi:hypothetical protein
VDTGKVHKGTLKTLLIISDSHSNSTVGLAKPSVNLDDGDNVSAGTARRWLFHTFEDILKKVQDKRRGDLYAVLNGDVVELAAKHKSYQVITQNETEAVNMAAEVFEPLFQMCKGVYTIRGTEAHAGPSARAEEAFAGNFDNTIRTENGRASWWHLPLIFDGVRMDIMHHPKGGGNGRPYNKQNGVNALASDKLFEYANDGEVVPDLVIRSHLHGYKDSKDNFRTRAIITPAMSLLTSFVYRIGINISQPVGAILVYCDKGRYFVEPLLYPVRKAEWQIV